jgi:hypothetical protein
MTPRSGASPATFMASAELGPDVRLGNERPGYSSTSKAVASLDILVAPVGRGRFRGSCGGRVLVEASAPPFLDAARVLAGEGVDPATRIVMRHEGKDYDALTSTVGIAAGLDVKGDHFVKHRPRGEGGETADQTLAHASEPVWGSATPPQPSSAPGDAL